MLDLLLDGRRTPAAATGSDGLGENVYSGEGGWVRSRLNDSLDWRRRVVVIQACWYV